MSFYHGTQLDNPSFTKENLTRISNDLKRWLVDHGKNPEKDVLLVGTGVSGVSSAAQLSIVSGIPWGFVRKESDKANHGFERSDNLFNRALCYVIVDDFIASGTTVKGLMKELGEHRVLCAVMHMQKKSYAHNKEMFPSLTVFI